MVADASSPVVKRWKWIISASAMRDVLDCTRVTGNCAGQQQQQLRTCVQNRIMYNIITEPNQIYYAQTRDSSTCMSCCVYVTTYDRAHGFLETGRGRTQRVRGGGVKKNHLAD